mmetsp:Transcript_30888/g.81067  ORF Transcript_30888/g.81067 Transcript_30888/m.81067 type:complete len:420 (-) Transcript_30888:3333-4592(-)
MSNGGRDSKHEGERKGSSSAELQYISDPPFLSLYPNPAGVVRRHTVKSNGREDAVGYQEKQRHIQLGMDGEEEGEADVDDMEDEESEHVQHPHHAHAPDAEEVDRERLGVVGDGDDVDMQQHMDEYPYSLDGQGGPGMAGSGDEVGLDERPRKRLKDVHDDVRSCYEYIADGKFSCKFCGKEFGLGSGGANRSKLHITRAKKHLERCNPKTTDSREAKESLIAIVKTSVTDDRSDTESRGGVWRVDDLIKQKINELFLEHGLPWGVIDSDQWKALMMELRPTFRCPDSEAIKAFDISKVKVKEDRKSIGIPSKFGGRKSDSGLKDEDKEHGTVFSNGELHHHHHHSSANVSENHMVDVGVAMLKTDGIDDEKRDVHHDQGGHEHVHAELGIRTALPLRDDLIDSTSDHDHDQHGVVGDE